MSLQERLMDPGTLWSFWGRLLAHLPVQASSSPISWTSGISPSSLPPPPPPAPAPPAAPFICPTSFSENTDFLQDTGTTSDPLGHHRTGATRSAWPDQHCQISTARLTLLDWHHWIDTAGSAPADRHHRIGIARLASPDQHRQALV